jgi:hypothetical protein
LLLREKKDAFFKLPKLYFSSKSDGGRPNTTDHAWIAETPSGKAPLTAGKKKARAQFSPQTQSGEQDLLTGLTVSALWRRLRDENPLREGEPQ